MPAAVNNVNYFNLQVGFQDALLDLNRLFPESALA